MIYWNQREIIEYFADNGMSRSRTWFVGMARQGNIVVPKDPVSGYWALTGEQVESLFKSLSPGGRGKYDYRKDR